MSVKAIRTTLCEGVAILVLAGCEPAAPMPVAAKPSIEGEWAVTEYPGGEGTEPGYDYADDHDITLTFTDDTWVWTFDPPLPGVSEAGAAAVISGNYELLSDSRMLMVFERPIEGQRVVEYSVTATTLALGIGNSVAKARRM